MTDSIFLKHLEEVRREKQRIIANNIKYPMNSIIEKLIIYEPNLVKKIWDYIAPTRYNLNADDNVKYISLAPTPKTDTVKSKAFANNKYLEGVFPCIKRFYFNYETGKIQPIYDRSLISLGTEVFANCIKLKRVYFLSLKT